MNLNVEEQLARIRDLRKRTLGIHRKAGENMRRLYEQLQADPAGLDIAAPMEVIQEILVMAEKSESCFSYQPHEIESCEDYLIRHSIGVCTLGAQVLRVFNDRFGLVVNQHLVSRQDPDVPVSAFPSFRQYQRSEMQEIVLGFLLHDIGMFLIPASITEKTEDLTPEELDLIRSHSFQQGAQVLRKNRTLNAFLFNIVSYHHAPLFEGEDRSYPTDLLPVQLPAYVKICKLVDIFNAMAERRFYQEAANPVSAVTEIVRKYSFRDPFFQLILAAFVKAVGVYPPGSVVCLMNGQQAFVLDSNGPIIIPISDSFGNPLQRSYDPVDLSDHPSARNYLSVDRRKPLLSPLEYQKILPDYLK